MPDKIIKQIANTTISQRYENHIEIYTDGSRCQHQNSVRVAAGIYIPLYNLRLQYRLDEYHSIMIAELFSIYKALVWIDRNLRAGKIVILCDSKAAILSLETNCIESNLAYDCLSLSKQLIDNGFEIIIQWTPSHVGIKGNKIVDKIAKQAKQLPEITWLSPCYADIKNLIAKKNNSILQKNGKQLKQMNSLEIINHIGDLEPMKIKQTEKQRL